MFIQNSYDTDLQTLSSVNAANQVFGDINYGLFMKNSWFWKVAICALMKTFVNRIYDEFSKKSVAQETASKDF